MLLVPKPIRGGPKGKGNLDFGFLDSKECFLEMEKLIS
jgi:hypothetical protein